MTFKTVWLVWKCCQKKTSLYKEHGSTDSFAKFYMKKTARFLEDCPLDCGYNPQHHIWHKTNNILAQIPHNNCQARWWSCEDFGVFCNHRTWAPCSKWGNHEISCIATYSKVKSEVIRRTTTAWLKGRHATGQWSLAQQQIYNSMTEMWIWPSQSPDLKTNTQENQYLRTPYSRPALTGPLEIYT